MVLHDFFKDLSSTTEISERLVLSTLKNVKLKQLNNHK